MHTRKQFSDLFVQVLVKSCFRLPFELDVLFVKRECIFIAAFLDALANTLSYGEGRGHHRRCRRKRRKSSTVDVVLLPVIKTQRLKAIGSVSPLCEHYSSISTSRTWW